MEMKAITMDKVSCYINLRENEEKPKDYQHLTVPRYKLSSRTEAWYT